MCVCQGVTAAAQLKQALCACLNRLAQAGRTGLTKRTVSLMSPPVVAMAAAAFAADKLDAAVRWCALRLLYYCCCRALLPCVSTLRVCSRSPSFHTTHSGEVASRKGGRKRKGKACGVVKRVGRGVS